MAPSKWRKEEAERKKELAFENSEDGRCTDLNEVDKENERDAEPQVV